MIAMLLAAAAALPPRVDAVTDPVIVTALGQVSLPNAVASLRISQSFAGGVPRVTEQRLWSIGKKLRMRENGREIDMYFDGAKKTLVVLDKAQPQAVRFKLSDPPGQRMAGQMAGALLMPPGLVK